MNRITKMGLIFLAVGLVLQFIVFGSVFVPFYGWLSITNYGGLDLDANGYLIVIFLVLAILIGFIIQGYIAIKRKYKKGKVKKESVPLLDKQGFLIHSAIALIIAIVAGFKYNSFLIFFIALIFLMVFIVSEYYSTNFASKKQWVLINSATALIFAILAGLRYSSFFIFFIALISFMVIFVIYYWVSFISNKPKK